MTSPARTWGLTLASVVALGLVVRAADIRVTPIIADGHVFASLAAPEAFTPDEGDVIKSGLLVSFSFIVELKRPSTLWFDRTLEAVTLVSSVKFDNLTGTYQVSKQQDDKVTWSDRTDREDQVRTWVTQFERVPLDAHEPLEPNAEYYVQVHVHTSPRRTFSLWPWGHDEGAGRADFTFLR